MGKNGNGGKTKQRFHKNKQHQMVMPGVSGLILTVDPFNSIKATKEIQLLLEPLKRVALSDHSNLSKEEANESHECNNNEGDIQQPRTLSIAAMLASELDDFRKPDKYVSEDGSLKRAPREKEWRKQWFSSLETNCRGHIFINIPHMDSLAEDEKNGNDEEKDTEESKRKRLRAEGDENDAITTSVVTSSSNCNDSEDILVSLEEEPRTTTADYAPSTTGSPPMAAISDIAQTAKQFKYNPLVSEIVEELMTDLAKNPRPVTRFAYRMRPVEISCYPTTKMIVHCCDKVISPLQVPEGRGALKIHVNITVKNNTSVEKEKHFMRAAIEASLPKTKFMVMPWVGKGVEVDAVLNVFVAHSVCLIGVARHFTQAEGRMAYNLHDFGKDTLQLSNSVLPSDNK